MTNAVSASDRSLLSEGVFRQLKIVSYHPSIDKSNTRRNTQSNGTNCPGQISDLCPDTAFGKYCSPSTVGIS